MRYVTVRACTDLDYWKMYNSLLVVDNRSLQMIYTILTMLYFTSVHVSCSYTCPVSGVTYT